jgi:hypothetical protein
MRAKAPLSLALLAGLVASASGHAVILTPQQRNTLTQLDTLPSRDQLNSVHETPQAAVTTLRGVALDGADPAVQIRAIRALVQYCAAPCPADEEPHLTLVTLMTEPRYRDARSGSDVLVLRAAIEALGLLQVAEDIDLLIPQLTHPSRDIRAAAAHGLRDLGNPAAIDALRARLPDEIAVKQVYIAIEDALRVLDGQPVASPPQNP